MPASSVPAPSKPDLSKQDSQDFKGSIVLNGVVISEGNQMEGPWSKEDCKLLVNDKI